MIELEVIEAARYPRPSAEDIAWAEESLGVSFPPYYLAFVKRYGGGVIDEHIQIDSPSRSVPDNVVDRAPVALALILEFLENGWADLEPDGSAELAQRFLPFGSTWNGDVLVWDRGATTGAGLECYVVAEGVASVRHVPGGFPALVEGLFRDDIRNILGPGWRPLSRRFRAFGPPTETPPRSGPP